MNRRTALVVGATGLIGQALLQQLLEDKNYRTVVTLTRRYLGFTHDRLVQLVVDYNELREMRQLIEATDIYCCLGTTMKKAGSKDAFRLVDYQYVMDVATIAEANGSKNFYLVSSIGANPKSKNFYLRVKGEVEQALRQLSFESLNIFRPSYLDGNRQESRTGESVGLKVANTLSFAMIGGLKKYRPIHAEQVAKGMRAIAHAATQGVHVFESDKIQAL